MYAPASDLPEGTEESPLPPQNNTPENPIYIRKYLFCIRTKLVKYIDFQCCKRELRWSVKFICIVAIIAPIINLISILREAENDEATAMSVVGFIFNCIALFIVVPLLIFTCDLKASAKRLILFAKIYYYWTIFSLFLYTIITIIIVCYSPGVVYAVIICIVWIITVLICIAFTYILFNFYEWLMLGEMDIVNNFRGEYIIYIYIYILYSIPHPMKSNIHENVPGHPQPAAVV